jgi:hypothetical protein
MKRLFTTVFATISVLALASAAGAGVTLGDSGVAPATAPADAAATPAVTGPVGDVSGQDAVAAPSVALSVAPDASRPADLRFNDKMVDNGVPRAAKTAYIDPPNVFANAVTDPETWALLMVGFVAVGAPVYGSLSRPKPDL